jgi:hypothetical protein
MSLGCSNSAQLCSIGSCGLYQREKRDSGGTTQSGWKKTTMGKVFGPGVIRTVSTVRFEEAQIRGYILNQEQLEGQGSEYDGKF